MDRDHLIPGEDPVRGASHASSSAVQDVGVDHRGWDVPGAQQLLDGAHVVAVLERMGGEGVSQTVAWGVLPDPAGDRRVPERLLEQRLVEMVRLSPETERDELKVKLELVKDVAVPAEVLANEIEDWFSRLS